ncbi:MAG TPA: hypothetical protein ENJ62_06080, partial [Bryobacterales bacterium]|nr:hypothetical protein [Bryobacterales bacterium]
MTKTSPRRPDVRRRLTLLAGHPAVVLTATTSLALVAGWAGARGATAFTFAAASALGAVLILAWTCRPERDLPLVVQALSRFSTQRDYAGARAAIAQIRRRPTAAALDALCEALLDTVDISEAEDTDVRKVLRF